MITKENILEICSSYSKSRFESLMPNTKLTESGNMKMGVCLGFLYGLKLAGNQEMFDTFADNFIRVFNHPYICPTEMAVTTSLVYGHENKEGDDKYIKKNKYICELHDDGSPLSFGFCTYVYDPDGNGSYCKQFGYSCEWYRHQIHGGLIFHGLGQQFSVTLDNQPGWQIHT